MAELAHLPAWQMAAGIRNGSFSPTELFEAHLGQIERWNPKLNTFVSIDENRARLQAKEADDAVRTGRPLGPLHGVPMAQLMVTSAPFAMVATRELSCAGVDH